MSVYPRGIPFTQQLVGHNLQARNTSTSLKATQYNVSNRSWGNRHLRKLAVQSYLTFHSLLDNWRVTEKLFTEQAKEFSAFIPSDQVQQ